MAGYGRLPPIDPGLRTGAFDPMLTLRAPTIHLGLKKKPDVRRVLQYVPQFIPCGADVDEDRL
jgi:hypothetical protein